MRTFIGKTPTGCEFIVREGRGVVTAVAFSDVPGKTRIEFLVENPPEIHPAIQIFLTPLVDDFSPVLVEARALEDSGAPVDFRIEWHRAAHVDPRIPIAEVSERDLEMLLVMLVESEVSDSWTSQALAVDAAR